MNIDELRKTIEQRTGVPASLLTGETPEENIAQAKAMLAYKREYGQQREETAAEQFSKWMAEQLGETEPEPKDTAGDALAAIAESVRVESGGYPIIRDGGQIDAGSMASARSAADLFSEWLESRTAIDLSISPDGWKEIIF